MKPAQFLEPETLEEACSLTAEHIDDCKLVASGQSLIPMLQQRLLTPGYLISIRNLAGLDYIKEDGGMLRIGALTTQRAVETSEIVKKRLPLLAEAVHSIGTVQIRNWGTIGGSLAEADPSGDPPPALLALGARVRAVSARGEREISIDDFFIDYLQSSLEPDEIITEIIVPFPPPKTGGTYIKDVVRAGDTGIVTVAVLATLDDKETVKAATIVLGGQAAVPVRAKRAEEAATGKTAADDLQAVAEAASQDADPAPDVLGSIEYKRHLAGLRTKEALRIAIERAKS
jgi:CO/xanthine dehydrogenase FAD-binding subunit